MTNVSEPTGMAFLSSIFSASWRTAYSALNGTSMYEMLRLVDQIDRASLTDLLTVAESMKFTINLPRILFAVDVVLNRKVPTDAPDAVSIADAKNFLARRSPLEIPRDPTGTLPKGVAGQAAPSDDDFQSGADMLGVEVAAVRAVAAVESGGRSGFAPDGRPIVRYELHIFRGRTKHKYDKTHPHLSESYRAGRAFHGLGQAHEWSMIYGAMMLRDCVDVAQASASWGMFQIMAFNYDKAGYGSVRDFVADMFSSAGQLQAFLQYCQNRGLDKYLAKKDWAQFAYHYNGSDYATNHYDTHLATAYARYSKTAASH